MRKLRDRGLSYAEMAVLYRLHAQSRVIEEMFVRAGLPYRVFGGTRFYDRREIKDALAYLRVIVNPADTVSLTRIINVPKRSIGDATVGLLEKEATAQGLPLFSVLSSPPDSMASRPRRFVSEFAELMFRMIAAQETMPLSEFVQYVLDETGLSRQLENEDAETNQTRQENLLELVGAAREFENKSDDKSLTAYLENVALITELDRQEDAPQYVTLMTLHSAKGLEYDAVFIAGMEENIFPSYRALMEEDRMEEERRLCYVGITRARKFLHLSYARQRTIFNQVSHNGPSCFIKEIPARLIHDVWQDAQSKFGDFPESRQRFGHAPRAARPVSFGSPGMGQQRDPLQIPGVSRGFVQSPARKLEMNALQAMYQPGDYVMHRKFGEGRVEKITGSGGDARITISCTAYGLEEFSLAIAPIFKLDT